MNWTLDQLNAFVTAVDAGSFSSAARRLGKAQSRVSTAIANLELDLGFELFDRTGRLPELTAAGQELYIEANAILQQAQRLDARAMTLASGMENELVLAIDEAVPLGAFEEIVERLAIKFPYLKVTIHNGSQNDISQWVVNGRADIGILFYVPPLNDSLEFKPLNQIKHKLVVGKQHPLSEVKEPEINLLCQYRQFVIRQRLGEEREAPVSANHWHLDSYYYMAALVSKNLGWALIPEHIAEDHWYCEKLTELSPECIPCPTHVEIGIVKRRDRGTGPVTSWMYQELHNLFS